MTTKVTIEVPAHANYCVETVTASRNKVLPAMYLLAGQRTDIYLHDDLQIVSIREVPVQ
jgi:hypothetical protein